MAGSSKKSFSFFCFFFERQKLHINVLYWLVNLILKYNCVQCSIGSIGVTLQFIWDYLIVVIPSCNTSLLAINGQQKLDIFLQKWSFLPFFFFLYFCHNLPSLNHPKHILNCVLVAGSSKISFRSLPLWGGLSLQIIKTWKNWFFDFFFILKKDTKIYYNKQK